MCGLVFVANHQGTLFEKGALNRAFRNLLILDTIRGAHSTGFFTVNKKDGKARWIKAAVDGYRFTQIDTVKDYLAEGHLTNIMVGHNRYATAGAINNDNAHPFKHNHITGVHNGGVHDRSILCGSKEEHPVDSDELYFHMAKRGTEDLIENLNANYALIWHDEKQETVSFLRNWSTSERPFWFAKLDGGYWLGASEKAMLEVVIARDSMLSNKKVEYIELPRGVEWVFSVKNGAFEFKEAIERPMPSFRKQYHYSPVSKAATTHKPVVDIVTTNQKYNDIIKEVVPELKCGDRVNFYPTDIKSYTQSSPACCVEGLLDIAGVNVVTHAHGVDCELADNFLESEYNWTGEVKSAYLSKDKELHLMLVYANPEDPAYHLQRGIETMFDDEELEDDNVVHFAKMTSDGTAYTREEWKEVMHCAYCGDNLPGFDSRLVEECDTVTKHWVLCPSCSKKSVGEE